MNDANSPKRRRRRSCYDRFRMRIIEHRRARQSNPAKSAALQLLAMFSFILKRGTALTQPSPRYTPPPMSPRHAQRLELARRLDVAPRYVDVVLSQGVVPYARLFEDIRRGGVSRRDAVVELRKLIPEASLDWLDYIQRSDRWSELSRCYIPNEREDLTEVRVLKATIAWIESSRPEPKVSLIDTGIVTPTSLRADPSQVDPDKPQGPKGGNL